MRSRRALILTSGMCLIILGTIFIPSFLDQLQKYVQPSEPNCTRVAIRSAIGDLFLGDELVGKTRFANITKMKRISAMVDHFRQALDTMRFEHLLSSIPYTYSRLRQVVQQLEEELDIPEFRSRVGRRLSLKIQRRIRELQDPENCHSAPRYYCNLTNSYGLASGVHDLLWCFVQAYYSRRMLVVTSKDWHYTPKGWESYFRPLSRNCQPANRTSQVFGPGPNDDIHRRLIVKLPVDLAEQLLLLGPNPLPWWYGQFLGYALRPSTALKNLLVETMLRLNFKRPIVGLHIRRSDKIGIEATLHKVDEYMKEVEIYFKSSRKSEEMEANNEEKRIFLASDDPAAFDECVRRYPGYHFLQIANNSHLAGNLDTRYAEESIQGALLDVFLLARTDFIVCTLSSGFCRLAYELMQYYRSNALDDVFSLDTEYFYAYVRNPFQEVLNDGNGVWEDGQELSILRGDVLIQPDSFSQQDEARNGKIHDGLRKFQNQRTGAVGYYPSFEAASFYEISNYTEN